ncbi:MAG: methyltransferase domain-containing protein [Chloroflexales bacterium]|nr:methyltransferase domain-containing protein [Chloroflexales bacterium]
MNTKDNAIAKQIEERYGQYARQILESDLPLPFNGDGSAPQTSQQAETLAERLYFDSQLVDLPTPVVNASIGCGNPVAIAKLKPGANVLDLGSGGGIDCFMAAKAVGPQGYVIGVDATPSMIDLANKNKQAMGLTNVEFRLGKIEELPVASDSIDLVMSNCVIDISPDKTAVFQEAFRVLKSGGRMVIADTVILGEIPPNLKANIDMWAGAVITPLITLPELLQCIVHAHFVDIQVEALTSYGLENFEQLDAASKKTLTDGIVWKPLPLNTGLYSALIEARKP